MNVRLRTICLITGLSLLIRLGWAQLTPTNSTAFRVDHIGVNDGLTQGSVYSILKDSRGFLWFGTQDGLNRYDGHRFRTFQPASEPIPSRQSTKAASGHIRGVTILGIVEAPDGNLWIGTEDGLNCYDRRRDRFDCFLPTGPANKPRSNRTLPFYADKNEVLYLSDAEGLVRFKYHTKHKTILTADLHLNQEYDLPSSTVRTASGDVWLHAPRGIIRYNLPTRTLYRYFSNQSDNRFGPAQTIFSFSIDADDIAWLGTATGLIRFDYRHNAYQAYNWLGSQPLSAVYSLAQDQRGRIWMGTQRDGVLYFDKRSRLFGQVDSFTNASQRLSEFEISKIYVDDLGIIWANVDPNGLARIIPDAFLFNGMSKRQSMSNVSPDQRLSNYTIRGFVEERFDRIWIATENGINVFDPRTNRVVDRYLTGQRSSMPMRNTIKALYRDPQRRIWVGLPGGVLMFDDKTKTFTPILFASTNIQVADNYVRNLTSINDSTLVAATEDGLYALNTIRRKWSKLPVLTNENIFSLWYDVPTRQLWVGTYLNGYVCYQLPEKSTAPWRPIRSGLAGYMVLQLRPDPVHQLMWLATDQGLVALRTRTGKVTIYTNRQGLANSFVYGSLADVNNTIWLSTNRGISRLDITTGTIKNFDLNDGLQGYEFNGNAYYRTTSGELYFGGVTGFNRFRPDQFRSSVLSSPVHIYTFNVNEEPFTTDEYVGERNAIDLTYEQNTISMEFAALDYRSNGRNVYQYQLTNYDPQWVMAGEKNYARYANLPPGKYIFQVKAANKDGHWNPRSHQLTIRIQPPFWQTFPFIFLCLCVLVLGVSAWVRQRENAIHRQQADRLRLAYSIQEQVKKDIARDLHDEIGTRLATIKLYTTQLTQQAGETPAILSLKTTIFSLINDTISDVRNLLRKLNPQTLEQHGYVAAVEELFSRVNASGVISTKLSLGESLVTQPANPGELNSIMTTRPPADTEVMLYRITQELVNNSLKHANAHTIELHIEQQADHMLLNYSDDGQGFDYGKAWRGAAGLGLGGIDSRVAILKGKVNWQTQPGLGTRVMIDVPSGITSIHPRPPAPRQAPQPTSSAG
jgi:signal transduction histidine kinase/ligand-binding sensor domain-containing protein